MQPTSDDGERHCFLVARGGGGDFVPRLAAPPLSAAPAVILRTRLVPVPIERNRSR